MTNPFSNTKASYFNNEEIQQYWVSPTAKDEEFFNNIMLPNSSIPIRILGGKGSGKTHILRYYSYELQKLRAEKLEKSVLEYIKEQGYIGIYILSKGIAPDRFSKRGIDQAEWNEIFYYYINLDFINRAISSIIDTYKSSQDDTMSTTIINLDKFLYEKFNGTIYDLKQKISLEINTIDKEINNLGFPGADISKMNDIKPIFGIDYNFYDIIYNVLMCFKELKKIKILFIIDEFENFFDYQQIYYNTILRHPRYINNIMIRISGRLYAIKTNKTLDDSEKLLEDSEIKTIILEQILNTKFSGFVKSIYKKRIDPLSKLANIDLEESKEANLNSIKDITKLEYDDNEKKYFIKLKKNISNSDHKKSIDYDVLLNNISYKDDALIEKINTFLCYQNWDKNLNVFSKAIKKDMEDGRFTLQNKARKFEIDLIYQLIREYRKTYFFGGMNNIITMSNNNPRIFLSILNNIFIKTKFYNNINMFADKISCKIQNDAILETSVWFWNNFTEDIKDNRATWAVKELCDFFRKVRISCKPSEKTLISFAYDENSVSDEVNKIIKIAIDHSLLIETYQQRSDKNTSEFKRQLKIHPMLAPKWELPISVGGTIVFNKEEIESLFFQEEEKISKLFEARLKRLNPPFKSIQLAKSRYTEKNLFDIEDDQ